MSIITKNEKHYGEKITVNPKIESLRKDECLCLNCSRMGNCWGAKILLEVCRILNCALAVTRCREWHSK